MRDTFVRTLITLAKSNPNIELFTGDLGFGVLKPFWEQLPDQFVNAGIAEQNMSRGGKNCLHIFNRKFSDITLS